MTLVFQEDLRTLSHDTGMQARGLSTAVERSGLPYGDQVYAVSSAVVSGNMRAMRLAEMALLTVDALHPVVRAGVITAAAGQAEAFRWTDPLRVEKAVATILQERAVETIPSRIERLGRLEVMETGQRAWHDALQTTEGVEGWRRQMEPGACELCQWWSREDRIWPKEHPMPTHKGCECTPEAVIKRDGPILETEKTKKAKRLADAEAVRRLTDEGA